MWDREILSLHMNFHCFLRTQYKKRISFLAFYERHLTYFVVLTSDANPKFCLNVKMSHVLAYNGRFKKKMKIFFFTRGLSNIKLHVCLTEHIFTITGSIAKGSVQSVWKSSHLFRFTCKNIYVLPRTASVASFKEWLSMQIGIISAWNNL